MEYHDLLCVFQLLDNRDVRSRIINLILPLLHVSSTLRKMSLVEKFKLKIHSDFSHSKKELLYRKGHLVSLSAVHCRFLCHFLMKSTMDFFIIHFINKRMKKIVRQATTKTPQEENGHKDR